MVVSGLQGESRVYVVTLWHVQNNWVVVVLVAASCHEQVFVSDPVDHRFSFGSESSLSKYFTDTF